LIDRDQWPNDRPFITLSTQHGGSGCHTPAEIHAFLTYAIAEYDVDPARVYLTGLSCGAYGAWRYVAQHLDAQITALVAIAGDGRSAWNAHGCDLGRLPIWAFHGDADDVVAPSGTTTPMTNLLACDPPPRDARVTIYPGVGHDSWSRTYDGSAGHDIYAWLLGLTRP
jgi:predicted peptidase